MNEEPYELILTPPARRAVAVLWAAVPEAGSRPSTRWRSPVASSAARTGCTPARERREGDRDWQDDDPARPRWGFDGEPAPELQHLVGQDVSDRFPRGAANPVAYVNC